jgi:hypothetical protein
MAGIRGLSRTCHGASTGMLKKSIVSRVLEDNPFATLILIVLVGVG